jgi:hypothetical protein
MQMRGGANGFTNRDEPLVAPFTTVGIVMI